jgi:tripeptide aminopeptidase
MPAATSKPRRPTSAAELSAEQLVLELLNIPGKSGHESAVSEFIQKRLLAAGAASSQILVDTAHRRTPLGGETGNLILKLPGTQKAPRRMLSAHMDTVPICVGTKPVRHGEFIRSGNPQTGLGADNRAGCATILFAALEILKRKLPHPPLSFCWFVQEEVGLFGARQVKPADLGKPAMCFNWDGGAADKITIGATGADRLAIEITGLASHAGVAPEKGVSAIAIASLAIADLQRSGWHGLVLKGKHRGTTNVGYIHAGEATNVVTERLVLKAEARSHSPAFRRQLVKEITRAFQRAAKEVKSSEGHHGEVRIDVRDDYESFALDGKSEVVRRAEAAVSALGLEPIRAISNGGLDANWINAHGIPAVTLGCGQMNVHTVSEQLDLGAFRSACRIALALATAE